MSNDIDKFAGKYRFLSNFYSVEVEYEGVKYSSTEHAFQAAKTLDLGHRRRVRTASSPAQAKRLGRQVSLRPDWEQMKDAIMLDLNRQKFKGSHLRKKLLDTGDAQLIEGNTWGDRYWGHV